MRHTFLDLLGMSFVPTPVFGSDSGGGGDSGGSDDSGGGYTSFTDMFDGGGPGASGDSFSNKDNTALDTDGDGHISSSEAGGNLAGGIDGSEGAATDWDGDGVSAVDWMTGGSSNDDDNNTTAPQAQAGQVSNANAGIFGGYTSIGDMFDGGGPGASGDSYSTVNNTQYDSNNDGHISDSEALAGTGSINLAGGLDGSSVSENDLINSNLSDDEFWEEFESGTSGMTTSGSNAGTITDTSSGDNSTAATFYNDSSGWIDNIGTAVSGGGDSTSSTTTGGGGTNTSTDTSTDTDTNTNTNTNTTTTTTTDNSDNDLINDLNNQIKLLQDQLNNMSGGGTTVVYEGSGGTETALPDDYLTEADLARYFDNLDLSSNAYDPAAFLNAYGFALDPNMLGGIIPTFQNNGVYMRRAVKDKDTGEIRYVNVPIGMQSMGGNNGLGQFRNERRSGFGSFV